LLGALSLTDVQKQQRVECCKINKLYGSSKQVSWPSNTTELESLIQYYAKIILKNNYNEDANVYKNLEIKTNEFGQWFITFNMSKENQA
jgi:hypothetical protein